MKYRIYINMPIRKNRERKTVEQILDAVAQAGAGSIGAYSRVAMVMNGYETWRSEEGAHPYNGAVGKLTVAKSVRIETQCPEDKVADVVKAVRALHPYEEPVIELVKLEDLPA